MSNSTVELEHALELAADALANLTSSEWEWLCREERAEQIGFLQYREACPVPADALLPPVLVLGNRLVELMISRHPCTHGHSPELAGSA